MKSNPQTALRLILFLLLLGAALSPSRRAWAQEDAFRAGIAGFIAARNALLIDAKTSREAYDRFIQQYAARFPPEKALPEERIRATFEGLYDLPPARAAALALLTADAQWPSPEGAGAATACLRLAPSPETLRILLTHPGLPEAMVSPRSADVIEALLWTNNVLLQPNGAVIAQAFTYLNATTYPAAALDTERITLILGMALPETKDFYAAGNRLVAFGKNALASDHLTGEQKRELTADLAELTMVLEAFAPDAAQSSSTGDLVTRWRVRWEARIQLAVRGGGRKAVLYTPQIVQGEPPLFPPASNRLRATTTSARAAVAAPGATAIWRGFDGISLSDPTYRFDAQDMGFDGTAARGFARNAILSVFPYYVGADLTTFAPGSGEIAGFKAGAALFGWPLMEIRAQSIGTGTGDDQRVTLKNTSVRAFGIRLLTIPSVSGKFALPTVLPENEDTPPPEPKAPRGVSPTRDWFKLPSLGIEQGRVVVGYNNAIKFAGRFTGVARLYSFGLSTAGYRAGLNYNLRKVHNGADKVIEVIDLQENLLDSRYFNVDRDDFSAENHRLYDNNLFIGVATSKNEPYQRPDRTRGTVDIPYSAALDGVTTAGKYLFLRGQAARQKITDADFGSDTRWAFTGILGTRQIPVTRGVTVSGRVDGIERRGGSGNYGWIRSYAGVSLKLLEGLRLSGAWVQSAESGTARFPSDRVEADRGFTLRGDFLLGSIRFGYMNQYSIPKREWLRTQGVIGLPVGGFEPYISYDERFSRIGFGINVRLDEFADRFRFRRATAVEIK